MLTEIAFFLSSAFLIYIVYLLVQYDTHNDFALSEKITTFLHIFIPYLFIFLLVPLGFYLDVKYKWSGFGILSAIVICKFLPNASSALASTEERTQLLLHYFEMQHTNVIYGYLLTITYIAITENCAVLYMPVIAYLVGLFLNCKFYKLSRENLHNSLDVLINFILGHWKSLIYAIVFSFVYLLFPLIEKYVLPHSVAISIPPFFIFIVGIFYIIKLKHDSKKVK